MKRNHPRLRPTLLLVSILATSCGMDGVNNVGIDGTGALAYRDIVSYGRVRALGAVEVNGASYETQGATFTIDGGAGSAADLGVGDVVLLEGKVESNSGRRSAVRIASNHVLQGRIEAIDTVNGSLQVLSQKTRIVADTRFDASIIGGVAGLAVGDAISVSGFRDIRGEIVATRMKRQSAGTVAFRTTGAISSVDTTGKRLLIDGLVVDYRNAVLLPASAEGRFAPGVFVEVKATTHDANDFVAASVEIKRQLVPGAVDTRADIEGYVTSLDATDGSNFRVDGLPVAFNTATLVQGGGLTTGDLVTVNGAVSSTGTVVASVVSTAFLNPPSQAYNVQGRVFDALSGPVANAGVDLWVQLPNGNGYSYTWASGGTPPVTGANGQFSASIPAGSRLLVEGIRTAGFLNPCVASVQVNGSSSFDVEVVAESTLDAFNPPAPLSAAGTVTMSGSIFEMTAAGRQPIAGALVWFEESMGIVFAKTRSDRNGHYLICNLLEGLPVIGGIDVVVQKPGFADATIAPVDTSKSTVVDIELKRSP